MNREITQEELLNKISTNEYFTTNNKKKIEKAIEFLINLSE